LYFPESYKWSLAVALLINSIGSGAAEMGEIHAAGSMLRDAATRDDTDAWFSAWNALALRVDANATSLADPRLAARAALRACSYFQIADRLLDPADARKLTAYRHSLAAFERARGALRPAVERVEVPYQGTSLPAYFVHPVDADAAAAPAIVFFDGLDVNKEQLYAFAGRALAEAGFAVLIVDGPGNGESVRLRGLTLRHDYEVAPAAALAYLRTRSDVDAARIGLLAVSLGGYYATRGAAFVPDFAATCAWGGIWDYHAVWEGRRRLTAASAVSVDHAHLRFMLGTSTFDEALERLRPFVLDGVAQCVVRPFLIVHGAGDRQIALADAERLHRAIAAADKTLIVLHDENFGAQHAQIDNMNAAFESIVPWFRTRLAAKTAEGSRGAA
jgi:dipeptidyl aminopeptidase/acylaminoacyl peptidase